MATVDYTGRSIDLFIFEGAKPVDEQQIYLGFTTDGGRIVTGIQKLVQSFALFFLTEQGSIPVKLSQGSTFVTSMRKNKIQDEADVLAEFTLAKEQVRQQLALAANDSDLPDDEILDDVTLEAFNLDAPASTISLKVRVTSLAGNDREVVLPIPIVIK